MRRHRKLLIGLGLGLMLGASLLEVVNFSRQSGPAAEWTEEQFLEQADRFGYRVFPADAQIYTRADVDRMVREAAERDAASAGTSEPAQGRAEEPDEEPSEEQAPLTLPIFRGMTLSEAAEGLLVLGVLTDRKDLEEFLKLARPHSGEIQTGVAVFHGQPTHEEILAELLRKKR